MDEGACNERNYHHKNYIGLHVAALPRFYCKEQRISAKLREGEGLVR